MSVRKAVTRAIAGRYARATKVEKGAILDELCALTGWTRRHARRAIAVAQQGRQAPPPIRPVVYDAEVVNALRRVWIVMGGPCGKRPAPFMVEIVTALGRHGELSLATDVRARLLAISPATIDRALAADRKRLQVKGRTGTKPGSLLKAQIPIRTFAQWDESGPGFCEIDLVAHDGGNPMGEFCHTLTLTDVSTGWTEMRAVKNKAQRWVFVALLDIERVLPFPLLGIDSDNGSEFINDHLFRYCRENEITFTRTRPYRKNDNCFVEQKNWTVVRQPVGYGRFEGKAAVDSLNELYGSLRLWVNFFCPQQSSSPRPATGARVSRRYDKAQTPLQRQAAGPGFSEPVIETLLAAYWHTNPVVLTRTTGHCRRGY
ncbi:MAG: transposase family protein [Actinobacteria bacterium]|nr:transposase family protein [Actinomycetota bacterium]